MEHHSN